MLLQVSGLYKALGAVGTGVGPISGVGVLVPFQVAVVQELLSTVRTPMPLLPAVAPQMDHQFHSPVESFVTEIARELPCGSGVDSEMGFKIFPPEVALLADVANKGFYSTVHHLQVLSEAESVRKTLVALWANVYLPVAVHPSVSS